MESRVSGGKNIAVGGASASGTSETHGLAMHPSSFAPCRIAKRSGKAQKDHLLLLLDRYK
ncbi:MAG: hypothetical protein IKR81_08240 [Victivallales bacterium]|nr:hypothetical protein [Victivallales bacterium]